MQNPRIKIGSAINRLGYICEEMQHLYKKWDY